MKKLIIWLAKVFRVNLTREVEKTIYVDRTIEKTIEKQVALQGELTGDVLVKGNLLVSGSLTVTGEVTCHKIKGE